jgi:RND superfamily putative drug exporter
MHSSWQTGPPPRDTLFRRLAGVLARRRREVALAFLAAVAVSGVYATSVSGRLRAAGLEVPVSESSRVADKLFARLGLGQPDVVAILTRSTGEVTDPVFATGVLDAIELLLEDEGVGTVTSYYDTGLASLVSHDRRSAVVIIDLRGQAAESIATLARIEPILRQAGADVQVGGLVPAEELGQSIATRDISEAERLALPFAGLLTLLFFRSAVAAVLPVLIGAFALAASTALTGLLTHVTDISVFALNVGAFMSLGLSLDYSLLIVQRFREELAHHASIVAALATMLETAGRAIWVSGLTVAVSLAVLLIVPVPLLRSIALGGVLAVACAMLGALVLLPALLADLGPRVNRLAIGRSPEIAGPSPLWRRIGEVSLRHPWPTAGLCTALLITLALPALRMRSVLPDARVFSPESAVRRVEERLADAREFDQAGTWAIQVVLETEGPILERPGLERVQSLLARLRALPGLDEVRTPLADLDPGRLSPDELERKRREPEIALRISRTVHEDLALVHAIPLGGGWRSPEAVALVKAIRALPDQGLRVSVGGPTAHQVDVRETLSSYALPVALLVVGWNLLVLLRGFRSVLVPIKAALMNMLSLAASYGVLVWAFQDAHLAGWLDFEPPGGIDPTIPMVMFAVVFGLSMDYEVFLLSRIQEEYRDHGDNSRSVASGLAHTGRIISSAAAILLVVIGAFATGELVFVKEVGVGLAAAIFLDVTLVRALLVPATMRLLGDWNWWAPAWIGGTQRSPGIPAASSRRADPGAKLGG